jgi:polygalacturonase
MSIPRRQFLQSSLAVAAVAATSSGCADLTVHPPPKTNANWDRVPGILARIVPPKFPDKDFDVTEYGARGDNKTDCHPAFVAAIDACNKAGGGRVVVPAANQQYVVNGPIQLLSNVNLYVEGGARIKFGSDPSYYLPTVQVRYQGIRCYNYSPLIYAYRQTNIAVTGSGVLDGEAYYWASWEVLAGPDFALLQQMVADGTPVEKRVFGAGHHLRLTMFEPYECQNILLQGVTLRASPFWTIHPTFCTNVTIRDVTVLAGTSNDDGCDPDSCMDVLIEGCTFNTVDDNVSLKAGYGADAVGLASCENIVIQNCTGVATDWGGFTLGSNTANTIQNVFIQNCVANRCQNAFFLKTNRAQTGAIQNIFIRSCKAVDCKQFIYMVTNYNEITSGPKAPLINNIYIQNLSCDKAAGVAFILEGDDQNPIEYVNLNDIAVGSAGSVQRVSNALFVDSSNVTVGGKAVTIAGLL